MRVISVTVLLPLLLHWSSASILHFEEDGDAWDDTVPCDAHENPTDRWGLEGTDIQLDCQCHKKIKKWHGAIWAVNFTKTQEEINNLTRKPEKTAFYGPKNGGSNTFSPFMIDDRPPSDHYVKIHKPMTARNLTCQFPFTNYGREFNQCVASGRHNQLCWCATQPGARIDELPTSETERGFIPPEEGVTAIQKKTVWDNCQCQKHQRGIQIWTNAERGKPWKPTKCVFPFIYRGKLYDQCIDLPPPSPEINNAAFFWVDVESGHDSELSAGSIFKGCYRFCSGLSSFNDNGRCDHCNGYCCSLDPVLNNCPEKYVNLLRMKNKELPLLKKLSSSTLYCIHQEGYKSTKSGCWCGIKRHVRGFDDWGYCPCAEPITEGIWQNWSQWSDCANDCSRMSVRYRACASKNPTIGFSGSATGTDVPICEGQHIARRQCHCPNHETIRSRVKIRQMDRQLEIKNLKSYDAGEYFCIKETGQQEDIKTTDIMGQINLHIVELKKIDIVLDYDLDSSKEWKLLEGDKCSMCGDLVGEIQQMAICFEPGGKEPCKKVHSQLKIAACTMQCPLQLSDAFEVPATDGIPDLMTKHDIFWQTQVVTAGDSLRLLCQSRTKKSLMNAPLGWEFSPNDGTKAISLTRMNGFSKDPYLGFILPDNSLFIERLNYTHSGIYKCKLKWETVSMYLVEVNGQMLRSSLDFLENVAFWSGAFFSFFMFFLMAIPVLSKKKMGSLEKVYAFALKKANQKAFDKEMIETARREGMVLVRAEEAEDPYFKEYNKEYDDVPQENTSEETSES